MANTTLKQLVSEIRSIEDVQTKILSITRKDEIRHVSEEQLKSIPSNEQEFVSKWRQYEDFPMEIQEIKLPNNSKMRYILCESYIETSRKKKNMFDENGRLLPKEQRTIIETTKAVFFENQEKVYVILFTTNQITISKLRQRLFNDYSEEKYYLEENISQKEYLINPDLYYWLLYLYENNNKVITERFEIESISGFLGNIADENHTITGNSDVTPNLLVTKAFVSKFYPFRSLDVMLKYEDYRLSFVFNDNCDCSISTSCRIPNNNIEKEVASALIIYGFILPQLVRLFNESTDWSTDVKTEFAKSMGKQVIKEIAKYHGINLKELISEKEAG